MKIYVVGGNNYYINFIKDVEIVDNLEDAQLVVFTGGEDVTPSLYGCKKYPNTYCNPKRDKEEWEIFKRINPKTQIVYGCCRGSQFVCCMNGGKLVQHVSAHAIGCTHGITNGIYVYQITSTHHQMQYPFNLVEHKDYELLYTSYDVENYTYKGDQINSKEIKGREPEIVLYHKDNLPICLAVQGHPEMIPDSPVAQMISNLLNKLVDEIK